MDRDDIRRWAENYRRAAEREVQELRRRPMSAGQAIAAAMDLLRFDESLNGDPFLRDDPVSQREDEQMWEAWRTLRLRWPHGR
jgi:uncharacterized protein YoaH (UPF0181 family)